METTTGGERWRGDFLSRLVVSQDHASPELLRVVNYITKAMENYGEAKSKDERFSLIEQAQKKVECFSKATKNPLVEDMISKFKDLLRDWSCELVATVSSVSCTFGKKTIMLSVPISAASEKKEEEKKEKERKKAREKKKRQREKKSKAPDSTSAVLISLSESSGSENENNAVKNGEVPEVKTLVPDSDDVFQKLKTGVRDEAFWKCLYDGFLNGSGECFLQKLQENGVWQTLFPAHDPRDDEWFLQRVKQLDAKYQSGKLFPPETLAALLVVRGIRHERPSMEDKVKLHAACQIPFSYDYRFDKRVEYHNRHKAAYLQQAVVSPFRFDYSSKPYREWKLFQGNKPKSDVSENGVSQVARPSV